MLLCSCATVAGCSLITLRYALLTISILLNLLASRTRDIRSAAERYSHFRLFVIAVNTLKMGLQMRTRLMRTISAAALHHPQRFYFYPAFQDNHLFHLVYSACRVVLFTSHNHCWFVVNPESGNSAAVFDTFSQSIQRGIVGKFVFVGKRGKIRDLISPVIPHPRIG